jgi:hypothetical protein
MVAEESTGIAQALRVFACRRVQQNSRGLERLGAQDDGPSTNLFGLLSGSINERNTGRFIGVRFHIDMADDRVGNKRAVSGL